MPHIRIPNKALHCWYSVGRCCEFGSFDLSLVSYKLNPVPQTYPTEANINIQKLKVFRTFELKEKRIRKCLGITEFEKLVART